MTNDQKQSIKMLNDKENRHYDRKILRRQYPEKENHII